METELTKNNLEIILLCQSNLAEFIECDNFLLNLDIVNYSLEVEEILDTGSQKLKFKVQQFSIKSSNFYIDIFDENKNLLKSIECVNFESVENELIYIFNVEELKLPLHSKIVICLRTESENMSGTNKNMFIKIAVESVNHANSDEFLKMQKNIGLAQNYIR